MSNESPVRNLGLIAGSHSLPRKLARFARQRGVARLVAVAFEGETDPALADLVDEVVWLRIGQLSKLIEAFKQRGIQQCVMAGQIAPRRLFDLRPDFLALKLLLGLKEKNAHSLFGAIASELNKNGIELISAVPWLQPIMPQAGFALGPSLSGLQREDVAFGLRIARDIARMDIGQTVVVKEGTVLAVEGFEGTDACLSRGGDLAGSKGGAVAIKVAKPDHDFRFDIPCVGLKTMEVCQDHGISVVAVEAGRTLLLDQEDMAEFARKKGLALVVAG